MKYAGGEKLMQLADKCRKTIALREKKLINKRFIDTYDGRKLYILYTGYKNELILQQIWFSYCADRKLDPLHTADDLFIRKKGGKYGKGKLI